MKDGVAFFLVGLAIGLAFGLCVKGIMNRHNLRAIESGDAQYHPTTGKFMFNGELKAEKNE